VNNRYPVRLDQQSLIGAPGCFASLQLPAVARPDIHGAVTIPITRSGTLHGLAGWFTAYLDHDITLTNAPNSTTTNYAQSFLPLERAIPVEVGSVVSVSIDHLDGEVLRWRVDVSGPRSDQRWNFDHCTFLGAPLSGDQLRDLSLQGVPMGPPPAT
jgi:hypothetical protein